MRRDAFKMWLANLDQEWATRGRLVNWSASFEHQDRWWNHYIIMHRLRPDAERGDDLGWAGVFEKANHNYTMEHHLCRGLWFAGVETKDRCTASR